MQQNPLPSSVTGIDSLIHAAGHHRPLTLSVAPTDFAPLLDDVRAQIGRVVLIGTVPHGDLRFHPTSWLNLASHDSFSVPPAIAALRRTSDIGITYLIS